MSLWREFRRGLWHDLPPFRLVLGLCPTLAVTKSAVGGLGMGLAVVLLIWYSRQRMSHSSKRR